MVAAQSLSPEEQQRLISNLAELEKQGRLTESLQSVLTTLRGQQSQQEAPPSPGVATDIATQAMTGTTLGTLRTMANLLGLPGNAARLAANAVSRLTLGRDIPGEMPTEFALRLMRNAPTVVGLPAVGETPPATEAGRIARRTGEEVGDTLSSMLPLLRGANLLSKSMMVTKLHGASGTAWRNVLTSIGSADITKLAKIETAIAVGTGTAAGIAREVPKEPNALGVTGILTRADEADIATELVTSLGPAGALYLVRGLKNRITNRAFDPQVLQADANQAVQHIFQTSDPDARAHAIKGVERAQALTEEFPNLQITGAEASGLPGPLAAQHALEMQDPALAAQAGFRRQGAREVLSEAMEELPGVLREEAGPRDVTRRLQARRQEAEATIAARETAVTRGVTEATTVAETERQALRRRAQQEPVRAQQTQDRLELQIQDASEHIDRTIQARQGVVNRRMEALRPNLPPEEIPQYTGALQRTQLVGAERAFRAKDRELYNAVDPTNKAVGPIDTLYGQLKDIQDEARRTFQGRDLPASLSEGVGVMQQRAQGGKQAAETPVTLYDAGGRLIPQPEIEASTLQKVQFSFNELKNLRSNVLEDLRFSHDPNERRLLTKAKEAINDHMRQLAEGTEDASILDNFHVASEFHARNMQKFERPVVRLTLQRLPGTNQFAVDDSGVVGQFFRRNTGRTGRIGAREAMQDLLRVFEDEGLTPAASRSAALDAVRQYAANDLLTKVDEHGRLTFKALDTWLRSHSQALSVFPELRTDFATIHQAQKHVEEVQAALGAFTQAVKPVQLGLQRGVTQAQQRAEQVLKAIDDLDFPAVQQAEQRLATRQQTSQLTREALDRDATAVFLGENPNTAVQRLFSGNVRDANKDMLRIVADVRDDPAAFRGLRRAVWDEFLRRTGSVDAQGTPIYDAAKLREVREKFEPTLKILGYGTVELTRLDRLQQLTQFIESGTQSTLGRTTTTIEKSLKEVGALRGEELAERAKIPYPIPTVRNLMGSLVRRLPIRLANQTLAHFAQKRDNVLLALVREAIVDTDLNHTLALLNDPGASPIVPIARLRAHLLQLGAVPTDEQAVQQAEVTPPAATAPPTR